MCIETLTGCRAAAAAATAAALMPPLGYILLPLLRSTRLWGDGEADDEDDDDDAAEPPPPPPPGSSRSLLVTPGIFAPFCALHSELDILYTHSWFSLSRSSSLTCS